MSAIGSALRSGRRVVVTGMAGAGKRTFARQLSAKTGLPAIHLDVHFWKPGWVEPSYQEWRDVQSTLLAGEAWIADGNYHETLDLRLAGADTVVYLDTPWWVCAARAFMRGLRRLNRFLVKTSPTSPFRVRCGDMGSIRHYGRATQESEEAIQHGFSQLKRISVDLLMASASRV